MNDTGTHVLIVDDNDDVRYQLSRRLKKLGIQRTSVAENGEQAIDLITKTSFDLVLLDIMMPGMSGHTVLQRLREMELLANLPVIVISALDDIDNAVSCIRLGAEDYLTKPIDSTLLEARIRGILEKKRLRDEVINQLAIIREIFGRYVPQDVAELIVAGAGELKPIKKIATIMYTDIVGFTAIVESLQPEQVVAMLNEYFDAVIEPVSRYGGTVNQFQGDAMLITFNVPVTDARHAQNAVLAARGILQVHHDNQFAGIKLRTRIGINTGEVVAGNVGSGQRMNYTVHGDAVNVAARLEQLNKDLDTEILLAKSTVDAMPDQDWIIPMGDMEVRGKREAIPIFSISN